MPLFTYLDDIVTWRWVFTYFEFIRIFIVLYLAATTLTSLVSWMSEQLWGRRDVSEKEVTSSGGGKSSSIPK